MRKRLVFVFIAIDDELFLEFHILLELSNDIIDILLGYLAADLIHARQIDFISFDVHIFYVFVSFEECFERVDLELV